MEVERHEWIWTCFFPFLHIRHAFFIRQSLSHFTISTRQLSSPQCIACICQLSYKALHFLRFHSPHRTTPSIARSLSIEGVMGKKNKDKQMLARSPQSRYPSPAFSIFQASFSFPNFWGQNVNPRHRNRTLIHRHVTTRARTRVEG